MQANTTNYFNYIIAGFLFFIVFRAIGRFIWMPNVSKNKIKTMDTQQGLHVRHWCGVFGDNIETENLTEHVLKIAESKERYIVDRKTILVCDKAARLLIQNNDRIVSAFPYIKSSKSDLYKMDTITEWSHTGGLEAIVRVGHTSGCALSFFATDYALNKEIYASQKNIKANIAGLVYVLEPYVAPDLGDSRPIKLTEDFCGYFPDKELDEINFMGHITKIQDHSVGEAAGKMLTVGITPEYNIDLFIAHKNLKMEIFVGQHVGGLAWLQGAIEA